MSRLTDAEILQKLHPQSVIKVRCLTKAESELSRPFSYLVNFSSPTSPNNIVHLLFLGLVKKVPKEMRTEGNKPPSKLSSADIKKKLSDEREELRFYMPVEFQRKPSRLDDVTHWKRSSGNFYFIWDPSSCLTLSYPNQFMYISYT